MAEVRYWLLTAEVHEGGREEDERKFQAWRQKLLKRLGLVSTDEASDRFLKEAILAIADVDKEFDFPTPRAKYAGGFWQWQRRVIVHFNLKKPGDDGTQCRVQKGSETQVSGSVLAGWPAASCRPGSA